MRAFNDIADRLLARLAPRAEASAQGCYPAPCGDPDSGLICRTYCCPGRGCGPCDCH